MAGTINLALTQQFDMNGLPLSGGLLYFFVAATTTPQSAFQDTALTIAYPNPIVLDASGRVPMFYLADGNIKIRLTDKNGVTVIAADNLLVIGPSSGGGGGGGVDPTTILATGDLKAVFGTGTLAGFVRCNGNTIGNAVSGATERANADCQALFEYLWGTTVLGVFAGTTPSRGADAHSDWLANKRIALPDVRGRSLAGMDDMGATAAGRLSATYWGASPIVLGNAGGAESRTLTQAQLPATTLTSTGSATGSISVSGTGTTNSNNQNLDHTHPMGNMGDDIIVQGTGTSVHVRRSDTGPISTSGSGDLPHTHGFSITCTGSANLSASVSGSFGSSQAHAAIGPSMVVTVYIKL